MIAAVRLFYDFLTEEGVRESNPVGRGAGEAERDQGMAGKRGAAGSQVRRRRRRGDREVRADAPSSPAGCASDTSSGLGAGSQPRGRDWLAAGHTQAIAAPGEPAQRRVDLGQTLAGLPGQGGDMLALEGDRGALRVMLIIGTGGPGRIHDASELPFQRTQLPEDGGPQRRQHTSHLRLSCHRP